VNYSCNLQKTALYFTIVNVLNHLLMKCEEVSGKSPIKLSLVANYVQPWYLYDSSGPIVENKHRKSDKRCQTVLLHNFAIFFWLIKCINFEWTSSIFESDSKKTKNFFRICFFWSENKQTTFRWLFIILKSDSKWWWWWWWHLCQKRAFCFAKKVRMEVKVIPLLRSSILLAFLL